MSDVSWSLLKLKSITFMDQIQSITFIFVFVFKKLEKVTIVKVFLECFLVEPVII